jgi:hypothetical protein
MMNRQAGAPPLRSQCAAPLTLCPCASPVDGAQFAFVAKKRFSPSVHHGRKTTT